MIKILRKKNPMDNDFLELIKVKKEPHHNFYRYKIYYRNEQIGEFDIQKNTNYIHAMEIWEDEYKRRGLATFMHNYIENDLNIKIAPSKSLTKDGKEFYKVYSKK